LLPKVAYTGKDECNAVLLDWVKGLGAFKTNEKKLRKEIEANGYTSPVDWDWLADEALLGAELSGKLQALRFAKRTFQSRYAGSHRSLSVSRTYFGRESTNAPPKIDSGYNLLILFRLWNMVQYYFPNVGLTNKKWSDVLPEYIPKFLVTADSIRWPTAELISELNDTHSIMRENPLYSYRFLPVEFAFVENKLIVTYNKNDAFDQSAPLFELGDEIVSIDGHTPDYFVECARKYISSSNESALLRNAAQLARHVPAEKEKVRIVFKRDGRQNDVYVGNDVYVRHVDNPYYELIRDSIGYLYSGKFQNEDGAKIMAKFSNAKAIVIDMRCYPPEGLSKLFKFIARYFLPRKTPYSIMTMPIGGLPGYYKAVSWALGRKNDDYYKGTVVVLVNAKTQSKTEFTTMAFQAAPHTIVVGSQTAGADGRVVRLPLIGGMQTMFSGEGVLYPDGTNTQRTGIRIDHYVEPTIEGIKAGRDEVLEKALEIINTGR
jgi:C-terminal processing protease CtpA/Prc